MNERDKEIREMAWALVSDEERERKELYETRERWERCDQKFADLIRADESEAFVAFIQSYPHWLGNKAKEEIVQAIRARGNT